MFQIGLGHSNESYNPDCSKGRKWIKFGFQILFISSLTIALLNWNVSISDEKISMEMGENAMNNGENSDSKDLSSKSEDKNNKIQLKFLINKRAVSLQGILERMFEN